MREVNLKQLAAASSETARHINRRIVLNLIRNRQPLSRADLARVSGLQRSTVSLITEELIETGWVVEGPAGHLPRGRRPIILQLNDQRGIICVDIRPSETTLAIGYVNGRIRSQQLWPTSPDPQVTLKELSKRIKEILKANTDTDFKGIGISVPGRMDPSSHQLVFAPNLRWPVTDLKTPLERATGLEVELENGANACALAEMWFGNTGEMRDLTAITVSEGIGAGTIAHGQLITGRSGMAGEFGHISLDPNGPRCNCGNHGCWEVLAGNNAALRYYAEARRSNETDLTFVSLLKLGTQGDTQANAALTRMAHELARGTRMVVAALAPQAIKFIGEFTASWTHFRPIIEAAVRDQSISGVQTKLISGTDGATARVRGTIAIVFQKYFAAPV